MDSKDRNQLDLINSAVLPSEQPNIEPVTPSLIARINRLPTFLHAWNYAQQISCLEDKTVYTKLQIDASHWTKIGKGNASPPADERFIQYLDVVQNEIPLIWWAEKRGYDWLSIRQHQSDTERELAKTKQENADLKRVLSLMVEAQRK